MINQIITSAMFVLFGWFISHYAKNTMPRLIWSGIGIYFIVTIDISYLLYAPSTYLGLGILLPHFRFLYEWTNTVINTFKLLTKDTYYFFITVYYKTRNAFYWFIDFYNNIRAYFYAKENKKSYEKYYQDSEYEFNQSKSEKAYRKKQEKQSNSSTSSKTHSGEFEMFYSSDNYVVLGVSRSDNLASIKKAWRSLQKEYHTDKNQNKSPETLQQYTEITQLINNAWDEIKKEKK